MYILDTVRFLRELLYFSILLVGVNVVYSNIYACTLTFKLNVFDIPNLNRVLIVYSVCKAWNEIVTEIKRKRSRLHWFCLEGKGSKKDQLQNISDQLMQAFQVRKNRMTKYEWSFKILSISDSVSYRNHLGQRLRQQKFETV